MKVKAIHIISPSKVIESLVAIMKQVLSPKVASRINVHKSVDELRKVVPKSILPIDYEGEEKSIQELQGLLFHNFYNFNVDKSTVHNRYLCIVAKAQSQDWRGDNCGFESHRRELFFLNFHFLALVSWQITWR